MPFLAFQDGLPPIADVILNSSLHPLVHHALPV